MRTKHIQNILFDANMATEYETMDMKFFTNNSMNKIVFLTQFHEWSLFCTLIYVNKTTNSPL